MFTKKNFIFIFLIFFFLCLKAQDIHFSQFWTSPLLLNPANAGFFDGNYRGGLNYRNQYRSFTDPFVTSSAFADMKYPKEVLGKGKIGFGLSLFSDRTGTSFLTTNSVGTSIAYMKPFKEGQHTAGVGFSATAVQKRFDYEKLKFPVQYDGPQYLADEPNGESFTNNPLTYPDFQAGLIHNFILNKKTSFTSDAAMHHLTKPKESFRNENNQLNRRLTITSTARYIFNEKMILYPGIFFMSQSKAKEINIGSNIRYQLKKNELKNSAFTAGAWYRTGDAFFLVTGFEYNNYHFGFSYDATISSLKNANKTIGAFEVSIIYIYKAGASLPLKTTMPCKRLIEKPLY